MLHSCINHSCSLLYCENHFCLWRSVALQFAQRGMHFTFGAPKPNDVHEGWKTINHAEAWTWQQYQMHPPLWISIKQPSCLKLSIKLQLNLFRRMFNYSEWNFARQRRKLSIECLTANAFEAGWEKCCSETSPAALMFVLSCFQSNNLKMWLNARSLQTMRSSNFRFVRLCLYREFPFVIKFSRRLDHATWKFKSSSATKEKNRSFKSSKLIIRFIVTLHRRTSIVRESCWNPIASSTAWKFIGKLHPGTLLAETARGESKGRWNCFHQDGEKCDNAHFPLS